MSKILTLNSKIITHNGKSLVNIKNIAKATTLKAWYAARLEPPVADGTAMASLFDWSNNGVSCAQGTAGSRPLYKTNIINGLPAFFFDGVNDSMAFSDLTLGKNKPGLTAYVVFKRSANTNIQSLFAIFASAVGSRFTANLNIGGGTNSLGIGIRRATEASVSALTPTQDTLFHVMAGVADYTNNIGSVWLDSALKGTAAIGGTAGANSENANSSTTGALGSGAGFLFGYIAELVFCESAHTPSEIMDIMAALKIIYGTPQ